MNFTNTLNTLDDWGLTITDGMVDILTRKRKFASNKLINSIDFNSYVKNNIITLEIQYADHGKYVVSGRKRNSKQPPTHVIEQWIKLKRIPVTITGKRKGKPTGKVKRITKRNQEKTLAFVIARSIARDGIQPLNFLTPIESAIEGLQMQKEIRQALVKDGYKSLEKTLLKINKKKI